MCRACCLHIWRDVECCSVVYGWPLYWSMCWVCWQCLVSGEDLASGCLEWSDIFCSFLLIDVRVEAFRLILNKLATFISLLRVACFTAFSLAFYQWSIQHWFRKCCSFSCIIGSLTSRDGLLDIIIDPWWVIDGDAFEGMSLLQD